MALAELNLQKMDQTEPAGSGEILVVLNPRAGDGKGEAAAQQLEEMLRAGGRRVRVVLAHEVADLQKAIRDALAAGAQIIVVGGGDGTVRTAAELVAGTAATLAVIPLGTLNHFARDLGLPLDVEAAAKAILGGRSRLVDVAQVNDRVFLNNSSVGLYPSMVELRKKHPASGLKKWAVAAWAMFRMLRQNRKVTARVRVDGHEAVRRTPLIMVGNNEYVLAGFEATTRASLSAGQLAVYVVKPGGAWRIARLIWQILWGRAHGGDHMELLLTTHLSIDVRRSPLPVAFDGEVERMAAPLKYRVRHRELRVIVPEDVSSGPR